MYCLCSKNKGADQLRGYCEADLRLCFRICKKPVFSRRGSINRGLFSDESKYDFEDTSSCSAIQDTLTQLLLTLITVYAIAFLVCIGAVIVALLVLRIETNKRRFCEVRRHKT